ncbi:GDSL-type esterase/lipase family protein [Streptomyces sp. NPDC057702]|uniref:GDSL-type esterase/lipase family protein n=1 Tax=unclassified Streptomyces TaxID=2593676 RepID=UPI00368708FD
MTELITLTPTPAMLRGAVEIEVTAAGVLPRRLPRHAIAQAHDDHLALMASQAAGVRLALRSAATVLELQVLATRTVQRGATAGPPGLYDLLVDGRLVAQAAPSGGATVTVDPVTRAVAYAPGTPGTVRFAGLPDHEKDIEIWLAQSEVAHLIALRADAPVRPAADPGRRRWLHHGSSISHGVQIASPTRTWPAIAAARVGVELTNLGLNGNALLDPFTARAIRAEAADLISLKIGINLVNTDLMRRRALTPAVHGFLDTVREGHPDTPLVVVSPVHSPLVEDVPGPTGPDPDAPVPRFRTFGTPADLATGRLSLRVIRAELARVVAERATTDPRLSYLDGRDLYGERDFATLPLPDLLHPDAGGHALIGERFARLAFAADGPFGRR